MGQIVRPYTFVNGAIPDDSDWEGVFNTYDNLLNGQLDSANMDTTSSDAIMTVDVASTKTTTLTMSAAKIAFSGDITASAWTTTGVVMSVAAATYTDSDTAGSGTAATAVFTSFAQPSLDATNSSVTTTDAATVYIANAPTATGNQTITNAHALWVDAGNVRFDATCTITGVTTHGGNVVSDTDSTDDLGTTSVRWANVYTDSIGDTGQALTVAGDMLVADGKQLVLGHTAALSTAILEINESAASGTARIGVFSTTDTDRGQLDFIKSASASVGTYAETASGEDLGFISGRGVNSSSALAVAADILFEQDGASGADQVPGRIVFETATSVAGAAEAMRITSGKQVIIGDGTTTSNGNMTVGLTINQGTADDHILTLKSSDVTGGTIGTSETGDFFWITKSSAAGGGVQLNAKTDANAAAGAATFTLLGHADDSFTETTKTSAGNGIFRFIARGHDSANNAGDIVANGNCFVWKARVSGGDLTRMLLDEDGDLFVTNTTVQAFSDNEDDIHLIRALDHVRAEHGTMEGFVKTKWDEFVSYNEEDLIRVGVLGDTVENGGLWNMTQHTRLLNGAMWQLYTKMQNLAERLEENVPELRGKLLEA